MNFALAALTVSLVALAAASLPGKLAVPAPAGRAAPPADERRATERLQAAGWTSEGRVGLTASGAHQVEVFVSPACPGALLVAAISPTAETVPMIRATAGPGGRVRFLYRGALVDDPPRLASYVGAKTSEIAARMGLGVSSDGHGIVALALTEPCVGTPLPWKGRLSPQ